MKCAKCGGTLRKKSKKPGEAEVYRCCSCHRRYVFEDGKLKETA